MFKLNIDFAEIHSLHDLLIALEVLYFIKEREVELKINFPSSKMIYPEYLIAIVGVVKFLEKTGINVFVNVNNPGNNTYIPRINFYKELGINYDETFRRYSSSGRFVEITQFDCWNSIDIVNKAMKIIKNNCYLPNEILGCLNYCLFEIVDNVHNHADSPIDGYTVVQNYPNMQEIRLVVLDAGKGIYRSLTQSEKYKDITPEAALALSLEKGVTRGYGRGNGLYHVKKFISENKGELKIYTGEYNLDLSNGDIKIYQGPYWQGTLIYVRINTNQLVDLYTVFDGDIPVTVLEVDESVNGLW